MNPHTDIHTNDINELKNERKNKLTKLNIVSFIGEDLYFKLYLDKTYNLNFKYKFIFVKCIKVNNYKNGRVFNFTINKEYKCIERLFVNINETEYFVVGDDNDEIYYNPQYKVGNEHRQFSFTENSFNKHFKDVTIHL